MVVQELNRIFTFNFRGFVDSQYLSIDLLYGSLNQEESAQI